MTTDYKYIKYVARPTQTKRSRGMHPFTRKRLLIGIGIGVALMSMALFNVMRENYRLDTWIADIQQRVTQQQNKNVALQDELEYVSTLNYHVKKAKDYLNLKEPGEQVIDIQTDRNSRDRNESLGEKPTPTVVLRSNQAEWYAVFLDEEPYR